MISQTTEYALRAVVHLAFHAEEPQTTQQIATATKAPVAYLSKVLQNLRRAGIVTMRRGLHGGALLAKVPQSLTVYEVVQAVDPIQRILSCPLNLEAHGENLCPLHRRLDNALCQVEEAFQDSTIADLLSDATGSIPLHPFVNPSS